MTLKKSYPEKLIQRSKGSNVTFSKKIIARVKTKLLFVAIYHPSLKSKDRILAINLYMNNKIKVVIT